MKTMRMIGMALVAITLSTAFCTCFNDDDDNTMNGNGNNGSTIKTENSATLETAGTLSLVLGDKALLVSSDLQFPRYRKYGLNLHQNKR